MEIKPLIAVLPQYDLVDDKIFINPPYMNAVIEAGGLPVLLPFIKDKNDIKECAKRFDGFLFTGGQDVNPNHYGQKLCRFTDELAPKRDDLELQLFQKILKEKKPVLGICRGMQLINVAMGGTLQQDIFESEKEGTPLQHFQNKPYHIPVHEINIFKETALYKILGETRIFVNSVHHQGIAVLADGLEPMASSEDHLIEAFQIRNMGFGIAVQWHPEQLINEDINSRKLFSAFIKAASQCE